VKEFIKTMIIGGALFLLPLALILFFLSYALRLVRSFAAPIVANLHLDQYNFGVGIVSVVSVVLLIVISFVAGLVARTAFGKRVTRWSENSWLGQSPLYQMAKLMVQGFANPEDTAGLKPVLINMQNGWQIGYVLEQLGNDWLAVLVPRAPSPMSGTIMYIPASKVRPLDITMIQAMSIVKGLGAGSATMLRGVDLTLPSARS